MSTYLTHIKENIFQIRGITRGSFLLSVGTLTASVVGFIQTIILSTYLSAETFGTYRYIIAFIGSLGIIGLPGMGTALYQSLSKEKFPDIRSLLLKRFLIATIGSIGLLAYSIIELHNGSIDLKLFLSYCTIVLLFPISEVFANYESLLLAQNNYSKISKFTIAQRILTSSAIVLIAIAIPNIILLTICYLVTITLFRMYAFKKSYVQIAQTVDADTKEVLKFSWKLSAVGVISIIGTYFDKVFLFHGLGPAELASYSMIIIFADQAKMVVKHIGTIEMKHLVTLKGAEAMFYIKKRVNVLLLLLIPFYGLYCGGVYLFFVLFPKYSHVLPLALLYGCVLLLSTKVYHRAFLEAHQQSKKLFIFNIWSTVTKILGIIVLSRYLGMTGIVVSLVLSELVTWIILEYIVLRFARIQDQQILKVS